MEGLTPTEEPNEILCRMRLDLDGILEVAAIDKRSGASKHITIANALSVKSAEEIAAGRKRIRELYEPRGEVLEQSWAASLDTDESVLDVGPDELDDPEMREAPRAEANDDVKVRQLLERSRRALDQMHAEDREEAIELHERIEVALASGSAGELEEASRELEELLFFIEGQR